jgi:DNA repair exonuclease SbcCD ATPase subunit
LISKDNELDFLIKSKRDRIIELDKTILDLKRNIDRIKNNDKSYDYKCKCCQNNKTITTNRTEIEYLLSEQNNNINKKIKSEDINNELQHQKDMLNIISKSINNVQNIIKSTEDKINDLKGKITPDYTEKINEKTTIINEIKNMKNTYNMDCEACTINSQIKNQNMPVDKLQSQIKTCNDIITASEENIKNLTKEGSEIILSINKIIESRNGLINDKNAMDLEFIKLMKINSERKSTIETELKDIDSKIVSEENKLKDLNIIVAKCNKYLDDYNQLMKEHEEYNSHIIKLDDRKNLLTKYNNVLDEKSGIPRFIIKDTASLIAKNMNDFLNQICDFEIEFLFVENKMLKMYIVDNKTKKRCHALSGSGFQKFIINFAFRRSLVNVSHIPIPNFLIVDEGFGCLDQKNFDRIIEMIHIIKHHYDFMLIISHIADMNRDVNGNIIVDRSGGYSKVVKGELKDDTQYNLFPIGVDNTKNPDFVSKKKKQEVTEDNKESKKKVKTNKKGTKTKENKDVKDEKPIEKKKTNEIKVEVMKSENYCEFHEEVNNKTKKKVTKARCTICKASSRFLIVGTTYETHIKSKEHLKNVSKMGKK